MITNSVKKYALIFTGSTSLALGVFGLFVPILPTTPFLLLTSFCYLRSSKDSIIGLLIIALWIIYR